MSVGEEIKVLFMNPEDSYVIHFSYLDKEVSGRNSKKVIAIHSKNLNSTDSREFSIEKSASMNDIPIEDIDDWFDDLELIILDEFNAFLKEKAQCSFIYWTEDDGHGLILDELKRIFEARNRADSQKSFKKIPTSNRCSISYLFQLNTQERTFKGFIKTHNSDRLPSAFLSSYEEGASFEKKEYQKVRESILCKIDSIIKILNSYKASSNNLIIEPSAVDIEGLKPIEIVKNMTVKSWLVLFGIIITIFSAGVWIGNFYDSKEKNDLNTENRNLKNLIENNQKYHKKRMSEVVDSLDLKHEINLDSLKNIYQNKVDSANNAALKFP